MTEGWFIIRVAIFQSIEIYRLVEMEYVYKHVVRKYIDCHTDCPDSQQWLQTRRDTERMSLAEAHTTPTLYAR
jgi:hypothetical protein